MSLFLRNLFFTILQPGIVAGLIPYRFVQPVLKTTIEEPFIFHHFVGLLIFLFGFILMLICIANFAMHGRGTLSPADPTKKLVITGPYKFSRNPMYIGVMMMLIGESIFFQSLAVAIYALFVFIAFYTFVVGFEEPRLRDSFGEEYDEYVKRVRRWV